MTTNTETGVRYCGECKQRLVIPDDYLPGGYNADGYVAWIRHERTGKVECDEADPWQADEAEDRPAQLVPSTPTTATAPSFEDVQARGYIACVHCGQRLAVDQGGGGDMIHDRTGSRLC